MRLAIQIIKNTWAEYMMYRLSFVLWRVRSVMQLIVMYYLWWAIFSETQMLFGYTQSMMLTYILLSAFVRPLIMGTRTQEIGGMINDGSLSNYLIRPLHIFRFFFFRDIGDKSLNIVFAFGEIIVLFLLLRPPIFIQTNGEILLFTVLSLLIGMIIFFYFSLLLSSLGYWSSDVWAPRFLSFVFAEFFTGMLFPLDILPAPLFFASRLLPFTYFIYFPLKVYLGHVQGMQLLQGVAMGLFWMLCMKTMTDRLWQRGLRVYAAEGR
ncbi:ABC-2 family transporter protein [Candidatus Gottesmanbacteria bacterium]|nr:ABC-2 family transporter protein [Candidatus Gottesmanbacteria bacterium]